MKKYILALLLAPALTFAQPAKKQKEKPPTQKEMEDLMKEAQKMADKLSPEEKRMMDSLGIKMPGLNNVPQIGDKALADGYAMEGLVIPPKNLKLIATIPTKIFSVAELQNHVKTTNTSVAAMIKPAAKQMADNLIALFKKDKYYGALIASAANGMWMMGYKEAGIYLMGKAIEVLPNASNYNNYAAYLTMMGAAHTAIPVLNKLNSVHRKNSTILNNLAQAWLQLGDEEKATKYLDSTIMIYACHPQANYTKCLMLESKGKNAEALASLNRSLKHSSTKVKLDKLKELEGKNYKPRGYHIPKVYFSSTFNLNAYTAMIPGDYAQKAGMSIESQWQGFKQQIREEKDRIDAQRLGLIARAEAEGSKIATNAGKQRGIVFPPYYHQATERYNDYIKSNMLNLRKEAMEGVDYAKEWAAMKQLFSIEMKTEQDRFSKATANTGNTSANCEKLMPIIERNLSAINGLNKKYNEAKVSKLVRDAYQLFNHATAIAPTDAAALKAVLDIKADFLQKLLELKHEYYANIDCPADKEIPYKLKKLPDYDEVNCNIMNTINFPGFGSVVYRCNNATMSINSKLLPFSLSVTQNYDGYCEQASVGVKLKAVEIETGATFDKNGNFVKGNGSVSTTVKGIEVTAGGEVSEKGFEKGSIELGIDGELKLLPETLDGEAPVEISLKDKLGCGIEVTGEGVADFFVKNKVSGDFASSAETDNDFAITPPSSPSVTISADNQWSVNSGHSVTKGSLSGLK